ncbi:MAG: DUF2147 domain-containing protein [Bacteroidota bacterium]
MKKTLTLLLLFLGLSPVFSQVNRDIIVGTWLTASGTAKVYISREGDKYNGRITWLKNPNDETGKPKVDKNNPDKASKMMPLMGLKLLKNFVFDDGEWNDGTIYDPLNGKTYSCVIKYRDGKLDLRGYIGISLIGRTQTWFKVPDLK